MNALEFTCAGRRWRADLSAPIDLAITLEFGGAQPRFFADQPASAQPLQAGSFNGRVSQGASCNCATYSFAPHCHGTHTECVGHVVAQDVSVASLTPVAPTLALLITVHPEALGSTDAPWAAPEDPVISGALLATAAEPWEGYPWTALVVRTLPNDVTKRTREYFGSACPAPYFLVDAMQWVVQRGIGSLVVDLPSLDRADDGGRLAAHRTYWGLPAGSVEADEAQRGRALVTELAYVPRDVPDGLYLLDLQVAAFAADAAPSRPVLFPLQAA